MPRTSGDRIVYGIEFLIVDTPWRSICTHVYSIYRCNTNHMTRTPRATDRSLMDSNLMLLYPLKKK